MRTAPKSALLLTAATVSGWSMACSVNAPQYTADSELGSTHGVITVERTTHSSGTETKAAALAGFVRVPAAVDAPAVLSLVGFSLELPDVGQCSEQLRTPAARPPLTPLSRVEFLDAGQLELEVGNDRTTLAPHAFPTVTDSISGVVYTTRSQDPQLLPSNAEYSLKATGGNTTGENGLSALEIKARAPSPLSSITLNGMPPLDEPILIYVNRPLDITWDVSPETDGTQDLVYASVTIDEAQQAIVCAFRDTDGSGTVPTDGLRGSSTGVVTLHRLRRQEFSTESIDRGEVRFDFGLTFRVSFAH